MRSDPSTEIEVKFRCSAKLGLAVLNDPRFAAASPIKAKSLRSVYFDTAESDLARNGLSLRVRKTGRSAFEICLKGPVVGGNAFARGEWQAPVPGMAPLYDTLGDDAVEAIRKVIGTAPLDACFESQIRRASRHLQLEGAEIEVVYDAGHIVAGGKRRPVSEVELELKRGHSADLYRLAHDLASSHALALDIESKGQRGLRLAAGIAPGLAKAPRLTLDADATLAAALTAIVENCLAQFTGNLAAIRESDAPEPVHQARVALRRLRSALWLFRPSVPSAALERLRTEAKTLAAALGPAREADVFLADCRSGPFGGGDLPEGHTDLLDAVEKARVIVRIAARKAIDAPATAQFVLAAHLFAAGEGWRSEASPDSDAGLSAPARAFAIQGLHRLRAKAIKRGKHLDRMSDEERHALRILLKKFRYAVEFFSSLFDHPKRAKALAFELARLQDLLGAHNDMVTGRAFLGALRGTGKAKFDTAAGFLLGWQARGLPLAEKELRAAWKTFRDIAPFWE